PGLARPHADRGVANPEPLRARAPVVRSRLAEPRAVEAEPVERLQPAPRDEIAPAGHVGRVMLAARASTPRSATSSRRTEDRPSSQPRKRSTYARRAAESRGKSPSSQPASPSNASASGRQ